MKIFFSAFWIYGSKYLLRNCQSVYLGVYFASFYTKQNVYARYGSSETTWGGHYTFYRMSEKLMKLPNETPQPPPWTHPWCTPKLSVEYYQILHTILFELYVGHAVNSLNNIFIVFMPFLIFKNLAYKLSTGSYQIWHMIYLVL